MKSTVALVFILWLSSEMGFADKAYMERYWAYNEWSQNLPTAPNPEFLHFIDSDSALATKLREKWLYFLVQHRDWKNFSNYYRKSADISLQCFAARADFEQGKKEESLNAAKEFWLSGVTLPPACNNILEHFIKSDKFSEELLTKRLVLALEQSNLHLARYLLKLSKNSPKQSADLLSKIAASPRKIIELKPGKFHDLIYAYGLKRLISINMKQAILYWQKPITAKFLSESQKQDFIGRIALYKTMRNEDDAELWFSKLKPKLANSLLTDWQIRSALRLRNWARVIQLIKNLPDQKNPCWQYWLARALDESGDKEKSQALLQNISSDRTYYGFLANLKLKQNLKLKDEAITNSWSLLKPYKLFLKTIKTFYETKQSLKASRMLNDFILELPKNEKSALVFWLEKELSWHGKAISLANSEDLINQLTLRFPLAYPNHVYKYAEGFKLPHELIYAIIRQESAFREDVVSFAGAQGLMQIMPETAKQVCRQEKLVCGSKQELLNSQNNINIGVAYLKHLTRQFHHPVLAIASYNAGPTQVNHWLKSIPNNDLTLWIETIPWQETRNYVKNVLSYYAVYQYRLNHKSDFANFFMQNYKFE